MDYILVDDNLDCIEIINNNNIISTFYYYHYLTEYDYNDSISVCSEYIRKELIPYIYDITLTIGDICKAALIANNEYNQLNLFNSIYY